MKAGFERSWYFPVPAWVLGADGLEVTALLGHMPGGLEMLPTMNHQDDENHPGWLVYQPPDGAPIRVPRAGDPYGEIYRNETDPWRLILWKEYLAGDRQASVSQTASAWADFLIWIGSAERVHRDLGNYQHSFSWHFYGVGRPTANTVTITASNVDTSVTVIQLMITASRWVGSLPSQRGSFSMVLTMLLRARVQRAVARRARRPLRAQDAVRLGTALAIPMSLLAAWAPSDTVLFAARVGGGLAAGMAYPTTLALITALWTGRGAHPSIALWSGLGGAIAALGPLLSGLLLEHFWWGSVFLLTLPLAVVAVVLALEARAGPREREHRAGRQPGRHPLALPDRRR